MRQSKPNARDRLKHQPQAQTKKSESDWEESDSDSGDACIKVVQFLPICHCSVSHDVPAVCVPGKAVCFTLPGEKWPRCYHCANRVDIKRLPGTNRLVYMVLCLVMMEDARRRRRFSRIKQVLACTRTSGSSASSDYSESDSESDSVE